MKIFDHYRTRRGKSFCAVIFALVLSLTLTACGSSKTENTPIPTAVSQPEPTISSQPAPTAASQPATTYDPAKAFSWQDIIQAAKARYQGQWYGRLVVYDVNGLDLEDNTSFNVWGDFVFDIFGQDAPVEELTIWDCENIEERYISITIQLGSNDSWTVGSSSMLGMEPDYMKHSFHEKYDNMLVLYGTLKSSTASLTFNYYLRPWGAFWDDVLADDPSFVPSNYSSWYLPRIESGQGTPKH